jgi:hypothetical protein
MRLSRTDALTLLREALATLPSELDARSDFFVQWRARTIQSLELVFPDDAAPAGAFKEIDFSPRRLTKDDVRDAQLKLDAFLSGCVAARAQLEELVRRLMIEPESPALQPTPEDKASEAQPSAAGEASYPQPTVASAAPEAFAPAAAANPVIKGAQMSSHELCAPVRSSLSRVLGAWERGDRDAALVLSAQLLADLTVLSRDDQFKNAFDGVVSKFVGRDGLSTGLDSLQSAAPLCVWSMMAAMNEVMKARV